MPRIAPVAGKADVAPEYHYVVDQVMEVFGNVRGPFSILLHSPKLAERLLKLVTFNRDESVVPGALRSLAILAAVREKEAAYVWAAQVGAARRAGVGEAVIDLLRAKGDPGGLPAEQRDIIVYTRQLMRTNRVDQAVFDALRADQALFVDDIIQAARVPQPRVLAALLQLEMNGLIRQLPGKNFIRKL